jgi:hypothetical protein
MAAARKNPEVAGAAPFINAQALLARGEDMKGAIVRGIDPKLEPEVTDTGGIASKGTFDKLVPGEFGIVLGIELARSLFVQPGDKVTLMAPGGQVTPAGVVPRLKQFTVVGTFDSGHYEYDSAPGHGARAGRGQGVPPGRPDRHAPEAQGPERGPRRGRPAGREPAGRIPDPRLDAPEQAPGSRPCRSRNA